MSQSTFASLAGRRAVITGASTGIGRAVACELAKAGADVVLHCRTSLKQTETLAAEIRDQGRRAEVIAADLAHADELSQFTRRAWGALAGIDIWVNNAGVDLLTGDGAHCSFEEKLERLLRVDVTATIQLARMAGKRMAADRGGVILNVGWDQADRGMEGDSGELFAAAKNAIMGFTRSLAVSLAPAVRVNCIAPGWIRTAWGESASEDWQRRVTRETPLGRWGTPEDVANLARYLVSDEAAYLTGQVINVNGGAVR